MNRNFCEQLTNNLYRLTLFFPKKEPLRYKMREVADEILTEPNEKTFEILNSFFEVAKNQNWVSSSDILALQQEYANLKEEFKKSKLEEKEIKEKEEYVINDSEHTAQTLEKEQKTEVLTEIPSEVVFIEKAPFERQEKILAFLRENGRAQVWQIKRFFPEITKRTLRRDFEQMLKQGAVERIGEKNDTFYQIKR